MPLFCRRLPAWRTSFSIWATTTRFECHYHWSKNMCNYSLSSSHEIKKNSKHNSSTCNIQCKRIHPLKLTHLLKRNHLKRKFIHQPSIFRGYVSFQRVYCLFSIFPSQSIFRCLLVGHLGREWFPVPTGAQRNTRRSRLVEGHAMAFTRVPWCGWYPSEDLPKKINGKSGAKINPGW